MTKSETKRIVREVLEANFIWRLNGYGFGCKCGITIESLGIHRDHLAHVIAVALEADHAVEKG